ncbi:MAG: sodium:panthothenate symporter [Lentisphaeria bacterium]|nr:sodium:panthothenate symporter [Lentisphaeria bacterium]
MSWYDWLITILPVCFILYIAYYVRRYIRGVSDYLAAGRICGRYVLGVSELSNALAVITLVAYVEIHYKTGFALSFWQAASLPLGIVMSLTGFCVYRFRETRSMSLGQFLEMRYNRSFRIFAAALRSVSEILANMIMPAVAARFFISFLGLPDRFSFCGIEFSTYFAVIFICLTLALSIIYMGGVLSIIVTDVIQGMFCFPMIVVFIIFFLLKFSWGGHIIPVLEDRIAGESFVNPYDIKNLRDFNVFFLLVTFIAMVMHKGSWIGGGSDSSAAKTPHEQKMAGILGTWRGSVNIVFFLIVGLGIITLMHHRDFAGDAREVRVNIAQRTVQQILPDDPGKGAAVMTAVRAVPVKDHVIGMDAPYSQKNNPDTPYFEAAGKVFQDMEKGNALMKQFRTLFHQLMLPMGMRHMLPDGLVGLFCLMMVIFMVSSDDSRIYSACITVTQDCVLPFCREDLSPKVHIRIIRIVSVVIGFIFLAGSCFMSQLDYIQLFVTIMCSMWLGGCGPVILGGLYSRFGTVAGAFTSLITGMLMSLAGILLQRNWPDHVYPWLKQRGWTESVGAFLETVSRPFHPWVVWKMDPVDFPINSYEIYFITMIVCLGLYIAVSCMTCKEPFNLDRMLHRGIYSAEGQSRPASPWTWQNLWSKLIGITPEYTRGDRAIAWSVFCYSIVFKFFLAFVLVLIWNRFSPWPVKWWSWYFLVVFVLVPGMAAAVSTVWFGVGGILDLRKMFRDLKDRVDNPLDNGMVEGHVSLTDRDAFAAAEKEHRSRE